MSKPAFKLAGVLVAATLLGADCNQDARPPETVGVTKVVIETDQFFHRRDTSKDAGYTATVLQFGHKMVFRAKVDHPTGEIQYSNQNWQVECCVVSEAPIPATPTTKSDVFARDIDPYESLPPQGFVNGHRCPGAQKPMFFPVMAQNGRAEFIIYSTRQNDDLSVIKAKYKSGNKLAPVDFCFRMYVGRGADGLPAYIYSPVYSWYGMYQNWGCLPEVGYEYMDYGTYLEAMPNVVPRTWWDIQVQRSQQQQSPSLTAQVATSTLPQTCECTPFADSDIDNHPDCEDQCPLDQWKLTPGVCGCGQDDSLDTDNDGVVDCLDGCPHNGFDSVSPCTPWGDADKDRDVDMVDFGVFQRCLMIQTSYDVIKPECKVYDIYNDGLVTSTVEFERFVECQTGPSIPATHCEDGPLQR